ncbi:MAG: hypothetical protein QOF53_660 [Nocardioidaceae bacterium]|nr:hypothetical protein [Nocardioidaceae bacterium]
MTTATHPLSSSLAPVADRVPLRLQLHGKMGEGAVDGSWWPQSRDLSLELADLVDNLPVELGEIHRAVFSRPDWDTAPHRVRVARGLLKVGSYPREDNHQVWLRTSTGRVVRLSVTAPEAHVEGDEGEAESYWKDDGGSWWHPHEVAPSERT